jgi:hypothetical protein
MAIAPPVSQTIESTRLNIEVAFAPVTKPFFSQRLNEQGLPGTFASRVHLEREQLRLADRVMNKLSKVKILKHHILTARWPPTPK